MADKSLQFYRGPQSGIPTLKEAEPGWTTDEKRLYVGDGTNNVAIANKSEVDAVQSDLDTLEGKSVTVDTGGSVQPPETLTGPFKIIMTDEDDDEPETGGGLTQEQADQRYLQLTGGTISGGPLRLALNENSGSLYFGESIDGSDGMITSSDGMMGIIVGTTTGNRVAIRLYEKTGELLLQIKDDSPGSNIGIFRFSSSGLDTGMKPITNCPSFPLVFGPKTVATSAWAANTTYSAQGYGFRASVRLSGVTIDHIPDVTFAMADAVSGNLAPLADTYMGGIYIYAKEQPSAIVNIASVVCTKEV